MRSITAVGRGRLGRGATGGRARPLRGDSPSPWWQSSSPVVWRAVRPARRRRRASHPFLLHYLTSATPCAPQGTTGEWNAFNVESGGWREAMCDLSAYAGQQLDVRVSYVANRDAASKNSIGVFVDDTRVTTISGVLDADGFEGPTSLWALQGPPPGSPPANGAGFVISTERIPVASSVTTEDTVLFGFGLEAVATPEERADVLGRALDHLLG